MPARTNEFQKLVKIINSHLAPVGAKVTESAMIRDHEAETDREVDILVETTTLNCPIKIGIECTTVARALDIKYIEGFKEKHRKLGIHQTIVVAKNGFTQAAINYAKKHNIRLLSFSAAKRKNWLPYFDRLRTLSAYGRTYFLKEVSIQFKEASEINFELDPSLKVKSQEKTTSLHEFCAFLFKESGVSQKAFKALKENEESAPDPWIKVGFDLDRKYEFTDLKGNVAYPTAIEVVYGYRTNYRDLNIEQIQYDGQDLAVGSAITSSKDERVQAVFSYKDSKLVGTLEFSSSFIPPPPSSTAGEDS